MKKKLIIIFLSVIAAIALIFLILHSSNTKNKAEEYENKPKNILVNVKVLLPQEGSDNIYIEAQGLVKSNSIFSIPALSDGKIIKKYVNLGQPVKKGQLIAILDNKESNAELSVLNKKLSVNQSELGVLQNKLNHTKEMVNLGVIAQNDLINIEGEINTKKAERQDIISPIKKLQIRKSNYRVISGNSGYVSDILPEGSFVTQGQNLASLISTNDEEIEANIPIDQVSYIKNGDIALISVNGINTKGKVLNVYPNTTSNLIKVLIHPEKPLPANLDVKVKIKLRAIKGIIIPKSAIVLEDGKPGVYVVKNNIAYRKIVTIQKDYVNKVIISSGLNSTDKVVIENAYLLSDGIKVLVK